MNEVWKSIKGYDMYEVSSLGNIKSHHKSGRILRFDLDKDGYHIVRLYKDKKLKAFKVHRLVYCTFNDVDITTDLLTCHKNDIRNDNRLSNLFLGTNADNQQDAASKFRMCNGEKNNTAKLKEAEVLEIRKLHKEKIAGATAMAKRYGVCKSAIDKIIARNTWRHI